MGNRLIVPRASLSRIASWGWWLRKCHSGSAPFPLLSLAFLFCSALLAPPASAAEPGSIYKTMAFSSTYSSQWLRWPIDPSLPPGYVANYSVVSDDGAMPQKLIDKVTEWSKYWVEEMAKESKANYDSDPYNYNRFTLITILSNPVCVPHEPGWNFGPMDFTCTTHAAFSYRNNGVTYTSEGDIFFALPAQVFPPCPNGTKMVNVPNNNLGPDECNAKCPVDDLPDFPPAGDLCSASLEAGRGRDVNNACPPLDPRMQEAKVCLDTKIHYALGNNVSTVPEATIRTQVYQNHLLEIYKKWLALQNLTPEEKVACATIKAKVDAEKQRHAIGYMPSALGADAPHVLGLAVDMAESTIYDMASTMALMDGAGGMSLTDYLQTAVGTTQGCKLCWGGTFPRPDPVHIQYCP